MPNLSLQPLIFPDLELLVSWFAQPHVKQWWRDNLSADQIRVKYGTRIGSSEIVPMIIYAAEKPIGLIQYYWATKEEWPDQPEGTVGLDLFIGDPECVGKGYGPDALKLLIAQLLTLPRTKKIIIDVDPQNVRAQRAYEKAGFKFVKQVISADGAVANLLEYRS